jgi:hypothetical protein
VNFFPTETSSLQAEHQQTTSSTTRGAFLSQAAAAVTASLLMGGVVTPAPANAAKYGQFGAGSPLVLDPTDADIDRDVLGSSSVQNAIRKVKDYQTKVQEMQASLAADNQANLRRTILKEFDFAQLRDTLNSIDAAIEEDSQKGVDRLIRAILQDLTELEIANTQKDGIQRSPRRLEIMNGKLAKLDQAFNDYLAFAK